MLWIDVAGQLSPSRPTIPQMTQGSTRYSSLRSGILRSSSWLVKDMPSSPSNFAAPMPCSAGKLDDAGRANSGRYWVSAAWYESEPCAREVEPHPDRPWFRRLKVRFDWVDSQGEPWWLQSESGAQSSSFTTMPTPAEDRCAAPLPVKVPISSLLRDTPPPPLKSSETTLTRSPVAPQAGKATHHFPSPPTTPGVGFSNETSREPAPTHIRFTETGHLRFSVPPPTPPKSPELRSPSPSRADLQLKIWETPSNPTPTETLAFPFRPTTEETIITQKGSHGLARAVVPLSADYSM